MHKTQQIISAILNPLTLPFFGTVLLMHFGVFRDLPTNYLLYVEGVVLLNMCLIPAVGIWLLLKTGHVSDLDVSNRKQRIFPYLIVVLSSCSACFLLYRAQLPFWVIKLYMGSIFATVLAFFITLKWKISAHTTAYGCLIAAAILVSLRMSLFPEWLLAILILLGGLQASSRLYLRAHTVGQVTSGFVLGMLSMGLIFFLLPG
jgi:membrane-associated phospholipid phosphatase